MARQNTRTVREIELPQDWLSITQEWAQRNNFRLDKESAQGVFAFKRSMGIMMAPITLQITPGEGNQAHLEVWMPIDPITAFTTLFSVPDEVSIDSGEGNLDMERKTARMLVNRLLETLGQPLIT